MSEERRKHVSYLLRLRQAESDGALVWRASLESASASDARIGIGRPGERWGFAGLAELFVFLERETAVINRLEPSNILANGFGPGISSTMGVHTARQLDEVEQLQHGLAGLADFQSGRELTPRHWIEQPHQSLAALREFSGFIGWMLQRLQGNGGRTVRDYCEGQWVEINPIQCGLEFPLPRGGMLHAHPFTCLRDDWGALPAELASIPPVEMWFSALPPQLDALLREQALRVLGKKIAPDTALKEFYDAAEGDPQPLLALPDNYTSLRYMWVRAVGRKEGRAARCTCCLTAPMWDVGGYLVTSATLVAAALKILRGEIREQRLMTAETAFEPQPFYDEMAALLSASLPDGKIVAESFEWLD